MSFGYSIGDAALLANLAWKTFQNARQACGEHDELTREVRSIHRVLQRLHEELSNPSSLLHQADDGRRTELNELGEGCERVLTLMNSIVSKYNALSDKKKSGKKLWQKIRFGNGEMKDLSEIRQKMSTYTAALLMCINLASLGSQGRVERELGGIGGDLEGIRGKVDWIAAKLAASSGDGTVWTDYVGDDRAFWRELRRGLVRDGYKSEVLHKHKDLIKDYVKELGNRGVFDEYDEEQGANNSSFPDGHSPSSDQDVLIEPESSLPSSPPSKEEETHEISHTNRNSKDSIEDGKSGDISAANDQNGLSTVVRADPSVESDCRMSLQAERIEPRYAAIDSMGFTDPGKDAIGENKEDGIEDSSEGTEYVDRKGKSIDSQERHHEQKPQREQDAESAEIFGPDIGSSSDGGSQHHQTLKFTDALGRKFTFPFEMVRKWADFKNCIDQAFTDEPAIRSHVQRERYDLQGPHGVGIAPQEWQSVVQPGWSVVMTLWSIDSSVSKQRANWSQTQTHTVHGKNHSKKQVGSSDDFGILVRQMTGTRKSYIVNPRTTGLELKQLIAESRAVKTDSIYLFNHVDRRSVPDDVILWERGVRQGSLLEVLHPIWPQRPKIDADLILATSEESIQESRSDRHLNSRRRRG